MELKTSKEWYGLVPKKFNLSIIDPDGWDRSSFKYSFEEELISKNEFMNRIASSTITCNRDFILGEW